MSESTPKRRRRSTEEVRRLLLDVAREEFDQRGLHGTTVMDICRKAGVAEPVLFSNFGSKAGLFNAAVIEPFVELINDYCDDWVKDSDDMTPDRRLETLIVGLFDLARQHRTALLSALAESRGRLERGDPLDQLARALHRLEAITPSGRYRGQYQSFDMPVLNASTVGMVLGVALLDDLIFPARTRRPSRRRFTDGMHKLLLDGMRRRSG